MRVPNSLLRNSFCFRHKNIDNGKDQGYNKTNQISYIKKLALITELMPMEITRKAEYAIRILSYLAAKDTGENVPSALIAEEQEIPANLVPQLVAALTKRGWLTGTRGAGGGVRLAQDPEQITIKEVIEFIEGPIVISRCLVAPEACSRRTVCPLNQVWARAQQAMLDVLGGTTIADLVKAKCTR